MHKREAAWVAWVARVGPAAALMAWLFRAEVPESVVPMRQQAVLAAVVVDSPAPMALEVR